ncbi:hypothetical protein N9W17_00660 [Jannaschia sp.]|nr:hypothetical protein [Jannaschia sp.]
MTPEEAYAEAERRIEEVARKGSRFLDLTIPSLQRLPPQLGDHDMLRYLYLLGKHITHLSDIVDHPRLDEVDLEYIDSPVDL